MAIDISKGDRVAYAVKYSRGGTGPGAFGIITREEYGTVTSLGGWFRSRRKVHIKVENPKPGRSKYVERYADDVRVVATTAAAVTPELDEQGRPKLTYAYLASLAVRPDPGHDDVDRGDIHASDGAYEQSPLDPEVGLHIHAPGDHWNETEPEHPVHFIVSHSKIAEVYPHGVINRLSLWGAVNWRQDYSDGVVRWMDRLLAANPEITNADVLRQRGGDD